MKYGEDSSSLPSFDSDAWVEATGGPSHGRLYGFGVREKPQKILGISRIHPLVVQVTVIDHHLLLLKRNLGRY